MLQLSLSLSYVYARIKMYAHIFISQLFIYILIASASAHPGHARQVLFLYIIIILNYIQVQPGGAPVERRSRGHLRAGGGDDHGGRRVLRRHGGGRGGGVHLREGGWEILVDDPRSLLYREAGLGVGCREQCRRVSEQNVVEIERECVCV
jgi:hypothetical protein